MLIHLIALSLAGALAGSPARAQNAEQDWAARSAELALAVGQARPRLIHAAASGAPVSCDRLESETDAAYQDLRERALESGGRLEWRIAALGQMKLLAFARRSCLMNRGELSEVRERVNGWTGVSTLGGVLVGLRGGDDPARDALELAAAQRLLDIASQYRVRQAWFIVDDKALSWIPWVPQHHELAAMAIDTLVWGLCGYQTDVAPNYARLLTDQPGVSDSVLYPIVARLRAMAAAESIPELKGAASRAAEFLAASREAGRRAYAAAEREQVFLRLYEAYGGGVGRTYKSMPGAMLELPILQR